MPDVLMVFVVLGWACCAGDDTYQTVSLPYPPQQAADLGQAGQKAYPNAWSGTLWVPGTSSIITTSDHTTTQSVTFTETALRPMYDRRDGIWPPANVMAHNFDVVFEDHLSLEAQVNSNDFPTQADAYVQANKYATALGRIPHFLRAGAESMWIHAGLHGFGGGNKNFLVHTDQGEQYIAWENGVGNLEEAFLHEGGHTSLDWSTTIDTWNIQAYQDAVAADAGNYISQYAQDYLDREDVAESIPMWVAYRHRHDRITDTSILDTINQTIPNRIRYFDAQNYCMYPLASWESCGWAPTPTPAPAPTPTPPSGDTLSSCSNRSGVLIRARVLALAGVLVNPAVLCVD